MLSKEQIEAFKWRVWNVFKSVILPSILLVLYDKLASSPDKLVILIDPSLWEAVGYAGLMALLGSLIAGVDKVTRMK